MEEQVEHLHLHDGERNSPDGDDGDRDNLHNNHQQVVGMDDSLLLYKIQLFFINHQYYLEI